MLRLGRQGISINFNFSQWRKHRNCLRSPPQLPPPPPLEHRRYPAGTTLACEYSWVLLEPVKVGLAGCVWRLHGQGKEVSRGPANAQPLTRVCGGCAVVLSAVYSVQKTRSYDARVSEYTSSQHFGRLLARAPDLKVIASCMRLATPLTCDFRLG